MNREARFDIENLRPKYGAGGRYNNKRTRTKKTKGPRGPPRLDFRSHHIYEGKYAKFYFPIGLGGLLFGLIGLFMWLFGGVPFSGQIVSTVGVILFIPGIAGVIISISIANLTGGTWYRDLEPLPPGVKYEDVIWINRPSGTCILDI